MKESTTYNNLIEVEIRPGADGSCMIQYVTRYKGDMPWKELQYLRTGNPYTFKYAETLEKYQGDYGRTYY